MDSIAKIIDFQFTKSVTYFKVIFWTYFLMFVCPFWCTLVSDDVALKKKLIIFCIIPQVFVLF